MLALPSICQPTWQNATQVCPKKMPEQKSPIALEEKLGTAERLPQAFGRQRKSSERKRPLGWQVRVEFPVAEYPRSHFKLQLSEVLLPKHSVASRPGSIAIPSREQSAPVQFGFKPCKEPSSHCNWVAAPVNPGLQVLRQDWPWRTPSQEDIPWSEGTWQAFLTQLGGIPWNTPSTHWYVEDSPSKP